MTNGLNFFIVLNLRFIPTYIIEHFPHRKGSIHHLLLHHTRSVKTIG
jgi:hypothetical protein